MNGREFIVHICCDGHGHDLGNGHNYAVMGLKALNRVISLEEAENVVFFNTFTMRVIPAWY